MTLSTGRVFSEEEKEIYRIVFSHPKGNSLTKVMMSELVKAVEGAGESKNSKVILLQSSGDSAFCGGASFEELKELDSKAAAVDFFLGFGRIILSFFHCKKPIITLVQGKSVGGGLGLICAADYVLATDEASLRLSEAAIGIGPFVISPALERKLGNSHFSAMTYDSEWRTAEWAKDIGLFQQLFADKKMLQQKGHAFAEALAKRPEDALRRLKMLFTKDTQSLRLEDFERLAQESAELLFSPETQAFLKKQ